MCKESHVSVKQAIARGWGYPKTENKTMDVDLADAISIEVDSLFHQLRAELEQHRWIPVGERLPEREADVLTYAENSGLLVDEYCHKHGGYWVTKGNVPTHWKPIILPKGR